MALTKCTECGEEISKKAEKCPKCGAPTKKKTSIFTWLVVIILIFWMIGSLSGRSKTTEATDNSTSQSDVAPKQVTQVNIEDILSAYKNNEVGADNIFKGQIIQTTGVIGSVKKDVLDNLYVILGTGAQFEIPQIQAFFDNSQNNQLATLNKGEKLTVVCHIEGLMMNVLAKKCVIK